MPANPTPAQIEASRCNGRRSQGPVTPEGKARSARNARIFGLRSARFTLIEGEDVARYAMLVNSIHDYFQPSSPVEAAICTRMATAIWRTERAEMLESSFWAALPPGERPADQADLLKVVAGNPGCRGTMAAALRYLGESSRAFDRALRQLIQLRSGKAAPLEDAVFVPSEELTQDQVEILYRERIDPFAEVHSTPGHPAPPHAGAASPAATRTNGPGSPPAPAEAEAAGPPSSDRTARHLIHPNEPEPAAPIPPGHPQSRPDNSALPIATSSTPFCTNEPEPLGKSQECQANDPRLGREISPPPVPPAAICKNEPEPLGRPEEHQAVDPPPLRRMRIEAASSTDQPAAADPIPSSHPSARSPGTPPSMAPSSIPFCTNEPEPPGKSSEGRKADDPRLDRGEPPPVPSTANCTNEPEPGMSAAQALHELAHLRAEIAKRWPSPMRDKAEAFVLRFGIDGKGPPAWLRDLPDHIPRAG